MNETRNLLSRIPVDGATDADEILDLFLEWVTDIGFDLYPTFAELARSR